MNTQITHTIAGVPSPEFMQLPKRGLDPIFGLSRTAYYELEREGLIRFVRIRKPGKLKGRVLLDCGSVRDYLSKLAKKQDKKMQSSLARLRASAKTATPDSGTLDKHGP